MVRELPKSDSSLLRQSATNHAIMEDADGAPQQAGPARTEAAHAGVPAGIELVSVTTGARVFCTAHHGRKGRNEEGKPGENRRWRGGRVPLGAQHNTIQDASSPPCTTSRQGLHLLSMELEPR